MSENTAELTEYLADNPRMVGALFALAVLLSQAGSAVAKDGFAIHGP